jgi:hypothetical protein
MRAVPRLVSLVLIASGLAACQSTMAPQSAVPGGAVPASLPPAAAEPGSSNLRAQVAARIVKQYMTDAAGPAEVEPISADTFYVRFPVREEKARGYDFGNVMPLINRNEPKRRCITASLEGSIFSKEKRVLIKTRLTDDRTTCSSGPWQPYPELERMVDTICACLARKQDTCELSVEAASKAPDPKVAETKPARGQR